MKTIDKKLGIWGKDKIVREDGKTHAEDYYCVKCYREKKKVSATGFFPIFDPDIPFYPFCQEHITEARNRIILETIGEDWGD